MTHSDEKKERKKRDWKAESWPDVRTRAGAEKAAKQGATACFLMAIVTLLVVLVFTFGDLGGSYAGVFDLWNLIDVGIALALGVMIRMHWRAAAVLALAYYIVSRALVWTSGGVGGPGAENIVITIIILILLVNGIRDTFALAKMRSEA